MTWTPKPGGPYDVDEADYHADRTALSSTGARTLATSCPARFAYERDHGRTDTPTLEFGRAYHARILGTAEIGEVEAATWRSKGAEHDAAAIRGEGAIPLLTKDVRRVEGMAATLAEHPIAGPMFARPGRAEQTYVAHITGVLCRVRVDWIPDVPAGGRTLLVDLKTTASAEPAAFAKSMATYGYHQQGAFYTDVLADVYGLDVPPRFVLVAQEKDPPYLITIAEPDDEAIAWGRELNRLALRTYAHCTAAGQWPGYEAQLRPEDGGIARLALPGWQVAAYDRQYALIGDSA